LWKHHPGGRRSGLLLERIRRIADRYAAAGVGARHGPLPLLPDVGQLVSEGAQTLVAVRCETAVTENDLATHGAGLAPMASADLAAAASV
jgi:hypothetical protein